MSSHSPPVRVEAPSALASGTRLGEYELLRLLGVGGFGIVYLAFDHALEREVAVKEYMPASLVGRTETMHVSLRSQSDADVFVLGLRSFVNEAKLLARFDHPSLLKVYRFWEANGTAYMAMPVLRGRTLKEIRQAMTEPPEEAWLRTVLMQLLGAIEKLHAEDVFHRDIAPDNVQIEPDGRPVLMDFGAARRVLSDKSQALTAILKPAYAPIEQYGEAGSVRQGPWTDLYALGATMHYMLLARPPAPATTRTVHDEGTDLTPEHLPGYSQEFLDAIDWMLCPRPSDRPQHVAQLRDVLTGERRPPPRRLPEASPGPWERTDVLAPRPPSDVAHGADDATQWAQPPRAPRPQPQAAASEHVYLETAAPSSALPPARAEAPVDVRIEPSPSAQPAAASPQARKSGSSLLWFALAGGGVLAAAAAAFVMWPKPTETAATPQAAPLATSVAVPSLASSAAQVLVAGTVEGGSSSSASASASAPAPAASTAEVASVVLPPSEPVKTVELPVNGSAVARPSSRKSETVEKAPVAEPKPRAKVEASALSPAVPAPTAVPESTTPGPACGPREGVRFHLCMERECARGDFASHSACLRWKQEARRD